PTEEQTIDLGEGLSFTIESALTEQRDSQQLLIAAQVLEDPIIRSPMHGDTIALAGGSMSVAKLLSQMKIPPYLRSSVPLLVDRSGVVAVFGASSGGSDRLAQRFKAPLAHDFTNIYSSRRRNNNSEL
ncbi:MAG TPA: tRNA lysidine(34) synthetase TilS, partial [Sphaerochaeta sp.]|nr:tRNA lysidine(34) synthetase TilS [Sphaerochaeta sp.]